MVESVEDSAFLNGQDVICLLHHTELGSFAGIAAADVAGVVVGKDETTAAGADLFLDPDNGLSEISCLIRTVA